MAAASADNGYGLVAARQADAASETRSIPRALTTLLCLAGAVLDRLLQSGDAFYRVNLKDPDMAMARYLTDQIVGKPKERVEVHWLPR